jgi:hypothetical protein
MLWQRRGQAEHFADSDWLRYIQKCPSSSLSLEENIMAWAELIKYQDRLLMQPFVED